MYEPNENLNNKAMKPWSINDWLQIPTIQMTRYPLFYELGFCLGLVDHEDTNESSTLNAHTQGLMMQKNRN